MQRQSQYPKPAKKKAATRSKTKSKISPPIVMLPNSAYYDEDRSSVCSNGSCIRRRAAEEEIRLREELEVEIERELEQELIDGISDLVRRLSELKARQIARGLVNVNGGGLAKRAEGDIAGATRRWVVASFSQREPAVNFGEDSGYDSGCSDAQSVISRTNRQRRNNQTFRESSRIKNHPFFHKYF